MQTVKYVYWQDDDAWLGYLQDYADYWTQGETLGDLKEHLRDLYADLTSGVIPRIRKIDDLVVSQSLLGDIIAHRAVTKSL
ncbi:MAG: type II toxin-antitoxin system HicB family antitoxin [Gemmataceae bacterium]